MGCWVTTPYMKKWHWATRLWMPAICGVGVLEEYLHGWFRHTIEAPKQDCCKRCLHLLGVE